MTEYFIGPRTKGLRVLPQSLDTFRQSLSQNPKPISGGDTAYPLLTLDEPALQHNISTMANACKQYGVWLAPHVKTHMSADLWYRQSQAGAWAPTVAMPHQLRTVYDWGVKRILLANELVDTRDLTWLATTMASDSDLEIYLEVDSVDTVKLLAAAFSPAEQRPCANQHGAAPSPSLANFSRGHVSVQSAIKPQPNQPETTGIDGVLVPSTECNGQIRHEATGLNGVFADALQRLHPLVEIGVPGGRTGVRNAAQAVTVAQALMAAGFKVAGVIGFEGPVAATASPEDIAKVERWVDWVIEVAQQVERIALSGKARQCSALDGSEPHDATRHDPAMLSSEPPFIVSIGGSAYIDIVLPRLGALANKGWQGVIRSGSYITHDSVHYNDLNPWARLPGNWSLQPALTVHAQVLSIPESGLALLGAGKRDVATDLDLPVPIWWRHTEVGSPRCEPQQFNAEVYVSEVNDQHTFLKYDELVDHLEVGDVVGLSPSHPCTQFDKWRFVALTDGDYITDLYPLDF